MFSIYRKTAIRIKRFSEEYILHVSFNCFVDSLYNNKSFIFNQFKSSVYCCIIIQLDKYTLHTKYHWQLINKFQPRKVNDNIEMVQDVRKTIHFHIIEIIQLQTMLFQRF